MMTKRKPFVSITPRRSALVNANRGAAGLQDATTAATRPAAATRIIDMDRDLSETPVEIKPDGENRK
jgi:hypothetical protein